MRITSLIREAAEHCLPKKKLGLALGCGGAKGMAHLGVLKAFEEQNIFFDEYAGTSIGSIVGALRAYGYTSDRLKEIVFGICLKEYVRYLRPYMDMTFIEELLNEYLRGASFDDLSAPFFAWATDKENMQGVLLDSGSVARACIASSAVPPYFHGVDMAGKELIDGVYTNMVPADVLKARGADFIVGVDLNDVSEGSVTHYYNRITKIVSVALDSTVKLEIAPDALNRGCSVCDVVLKPKLERYTAIDLTKESFQLMYDAGYREARERMDEILEKMKQRKIIR